MNARRMFQLVALAAMVAGLTACGSSSGSGNKTAVRLTGARGATVGQSVNFATSCNGASAVGQVIDSSSYGAVGTFQDRVAGLVSASLDPSNMGTVDGTLNSTTGTGVDLYMHLQMNGNSLAVAGSGVRLMIYDSFVGQTDDSGAVIQPYSITVPAKQGSVDTANHTFTMVFQDVPVATNSGATPTIYGTISVTGTWTPNGTATGRIDYQNLVNITGGTPAQGNLGAFVMPACGLF